MPQHKCGTELREATRREIDNAVSDSQKLRMLAGDYGKIWFCESCKKIVFCY
jgi:uncharacterized protein with PIN domain